MTPDGFTIYPHLFRGLKGFVAQRALSSQGCFDFGKVDFGTGHELFYAPCSLDDAEHFLHNHLASVASLRLLFIFIPESMSTFTGIPNNTNTYPEVLKTMARFIEGTPKVQSSEVVNATFHKIAFTQ